MRVSEVGVTPKVTSGSLAESCDSIRSSLGSMRENLVGIDASIQRRNKRLQRIGILTAVMAFFSTLYLGVSVGANAVLKGINSAQQEQNKPGDEAKPEAEIYEGDFPLKGKLLR